MAVWDCRNDVMYLVEGFNDTELSIIRDALNVFEKSHSTAPAMSSLLKKALQIGTCSIDVLQRFSKWCHSGGSYSSSMEKAVKVSELLFNGIQLPRLVNIQNIPVPEYKKLLNEFYSQVMTNNSTVHSVAIEEKTMNTMRLLQK